MRHQMYRQTDLISIDIEQINSDFLCINVHVYHEARARCTIL